MGNGASGKEVPLFYAAKEETDNGDRETGND